MGQIYDTHCRFCEKPPFTKNKGSSERMKWCEENCEHGKLYKKLGERYLNYTSEKRGKRMLTKEKYLILKEDGRTDKKIMEELGINHNKMNALKKEWGLVGSQGKPLELKKIESAPVESKPVKNTPWESMYKELKKEKENFTELYAARKKEITELETTLAEKTKAFETVVGASEKAIEENELLKREIEELKGKVINNPFASLYEKTTEENELLRELLKRYL